MTLAIWQRTITDGAGNAIPLAQVEVRRESNGKLAALYSDRAGATPKANPFLADQDGYGFFYAAGDAYRITATAAGFERVHRYEGVGRGSESDLNGLRPRGEWDYSTTYGLSDYVSFNGRTFGSREEGNIDNQPPDAEEDDEHWMWVPVAESADLAQRWAEEDEDVEVASGKYSAKHHALKAEASAGEAATSETNAIAASEASGDILFFDTYAEAETALGGLDDQQVVEVFADETRDGVATRYRVESAALVYKTTILSMAPATDFGMSLLALPNQAGAQTALAINPTYDTLAIAAAATIPATTDRIFVRGHTTLGDYGAHYWDRVGSSEPSHDCKRQFADGDWWVPENVGCLRPEVIGGFPSTTVSCGTEINAIIQYLGRGGRVVITPQVYSTDEIIRVNVDGSGIMSDGFSGFVFSGKHDYGAVIRWIGADGGNMLIVTSDDDSDNLTGSLSGAYLDGFQLDGNLLAQSCLIVRAVDFLHIGRLKAQRCRDNSNAYTVIFDSHSSGYASSVNANYSIHVEHLMVSALGAANGVRFTGKAGASGSNVTFLSIDRLRVTHVDGDALLMDKADDVNIENYNASRVTGGTGDGLVIDASVDSSYWVVGNRFGLVHLGSGDGTPSILVKGARVRGNIIDYLTGVDQVPTITFSGGAVRGESLLVRNYWGTGGYTQDWATEAPLVESPPIKMIGYPSTDANTLDEYEEGTWTPSLTLVTPGDLSVAYSVRLGEYQKVGIRTTLTFDVTTSTWTHTTAASSLLMTGAPFVSKTLTGYNAPGSLTFQGITKASYTQFNSQIGSNSNNLSFGASGSGQTFSVVAVGDVPSGTQQQLRGTISYTASA